MAPGPPLRDGHPRSGQADAARLAELTRALERDDPAAQRVALKSLSEVDPATRQAALPAVLRLASQAKDPGFREAAADVPRKALGPVAYPRAEVERIRELTEWRPTQTNSRPRGTGGRMQVTARVAASGCNFLVIDRDNANPGDEGPGR